MSDDVLLKRASLMYAALGCEVNRTRALYRVRFTEINSPSMNRDFGTVPITSRCCMDPERAGFPVGPSLPLILHIDCVRHVAEITNGVVASVPVNVINGELRPRSVNVEPCKAMAKIITTVQPDSKIPGAVTSTGCRSLSREAASAIAPFENAGSWIVVQQFTQTLWGKILDSHWASSLGLVVRAGTAFARCVGSLILSPS